MGASKDADQLACLPTPNDDVADAYAARIAAIKDDDPLLAFVQSEFGPALSATSDGLAAALGKKVGGGTLARLALLSLHDEGAVQWNVVAGQDAQVDVQTMFQALPQLACMATALRAEADTETRYRRLCMLLPK